MRPPRHYREREVKRETQTHAEAREKVQTRCIHGSRERDILTTKLMDGVDTIRLQPLIVTSPVIIIFEGSIHGCVEDIRMRGEKPFSTRDL